MKSVELTNLSGKKVTVFIEKLSFVSDSPDGASIGLDGGHSLKVSENYDEVFEKLGSPNKFFVV